MSKTARTPYRKKKQKRKDVRAARTVKTMCQTRPELWVAPSKY